MARLIIPSDIPGQITLLTAVKTKNTADGVGSVIAAFLTQQAIDLTVDLTNANSALAHDASAVLQDGQAKDYNELRDLKQNVVAAHMRGEYQFLKNFYKPNYSELENWGANITSGGRITIPTDTVALQTMLALLKAKHTGFPVGTSPLLPFITQQGIDLTVDTTNMTNAVLNNGLANTAENNAENERELRDNLMTPVTTHLHKIGGQLLKTFPNNPQKLIEWGYQVDQSKRAPKLRTTTLKLSESITTSGIVIGSTVTNLGPGDVHVYKGKTTTGTPTILASGQKLGVVKGSSIMTFVNPSTTASVKFTVLIVN